MNRVFIADSIPEERSALRLLLLDLGMELIGEAADWATTLEQAPERDTEILLIGWELLPASPTAALDKLRKACAASLVIVLISNFDARQQAELSSGADSFISRGDLPGRLADRLREIAGTS